MSGKKIGYARVSTIEQDLTAQREALHRLGVPEERIYVDHGLTGTHRSRPGLREAIRMRTREGMAIARAKGRLRGRQPKLSTLQRPHLMSLHAKGEHSQAELAELFGVARSTVYRTMQRESAKRTG